MTAIGMIGSERYCAVCGKEFIIYPDWAYKKSFGGNVKEFCSWRCLRDYEKRHLNKGDRRDAMIHMLLDGKEIKEVADTLGCDPRSVYYWKNKLVKEGSL